MEGIGNRMSTYATVSDYEAYTSVSINTPSGNLQALVDNAEVDIDRILVKAPTLTDSLQGIAINGATGGTFGLGVVWQGVNYSAEGFPWNVSGLDLINLWLPQMADQYGNRIPSDSWGRPPQLFYEQTWAFGPFPSVPIVLESINAFGSQRLASLVPDNTDLVGAGAAVAVTQIVGGGLRLNPYELKASDSYALKQAVCAQAEYRDQMGETFFVRAQWASVQGPEFKTTGKLPTIGPRAKLELSGTDLVMRGTRARAGTVSGRTIVYAPVGGTPIPDDWRVI